MSWGSTYKSRLSKIKTKQNKCIRCLFFAHSREKASPYFNLLELLTLENIFKFKISTFAYKSSCDEIDTPEAFNNYIKKVSDVHSYNTRYSKNLNFYRPKVRTNYGIQTFKFSLSSIWEEIPIEIKTLSFLQFKKCYKIFLLNTQV